MASRFHAADADRSNPRDAWWAAQVLLVVGLAVGTRSVLIGSLPADWYGDISTVHEYVEMLRSGAPPPGWYHVGIGPLFPLWAWTFEGLLGTDYVAFKVASATGSLVGLWLLFVLARQLVAERFALVATAVASVGSWWLVYSRLGDVQGLTPTVSLLASVACVQAVRRPGPTGWAVAAGAASGLGVYLYGNTMVLPVLSAATLTAAALIHRHRRSTWVGTAAAFLLGSAVLVPFGVDALRHTDAVRDGHVATRLELSWSTPAQLTDGYMTAFEGYVGDGDANVRGNPAARPHVDRLSLTLAVVGTAWWLAPGRRRRGLMLIGWATALHLPFALATDNVGPSVSRTTAAAPFVYLLVAAGAWAVGGLAVRRMRRLATDRGDLAPAGAGSRSAGPLVRMHPALRLAPTWILVGGLAAVNLHAYFAVHRQQQPYGNTAVAGLIVEHARTAAPGTQIHIVGSGWVDGMPEPKSIAYQLGAARPVVEHAPDGFDCEVLASIPRPALVLWDPAATLPSSEVAGCSNEVGPVTLHRSPSGRPLYRELTLS